METSGKIQTRILNIFTILADPEPGRPAEPGDIIFSELNWADIWADLSFYWSERAETFRADPNKPHDKIQIKNKMSNPSQEPPASSKASNEDLKDMDIFEPSKPR